MIDSLLFQVICVIVAIIISFPALALWMAAPGREDIDRIGLRLVALSWWGAALILCAPLVSRFF